MVMQALRQGTTAMILKYVLFSLLGFAMIGLVAMDVTGVFSVTGGPGKSDVARVGRESIDISSFNRTLQRTLVPMGISPEQAYQAGFLTQILSSEIRSTLVRLEGEALGVRVKRETLANKILEMISPMASAEMTPQETLDQILRQQGMSEDEFIQSVNRELVSGLIAGTVQSSFGDVSENLARDMYLFQNHTRDIAYIHFPNSDMTQAKAPTEEQLQNLYEALKETRYAIPESRSMTLAVIDQAKVAESLQVTDEDLRQAYDGNAENYAYPEQHVLEQAALKTEQEARQVLENLKSGKSLKDSVQIVTGAVSSYLTPQPFEAGALMSEIREQVSIAEKGKTIGPIKSPLGFHVIIVQDILPAGVKPFEDVKEAVREEVKQTMLADQLYDLSNQLDDFLAGGGSIADAGQTVPLQIYTLSMTSRFGLDSKGNDGFADLVTKEAAFSQEKDTILETGFDLAKGEVSRVIEMPSGRFMAVQVDDVLEKSYKPFEDVSLELKTQFMDDQRRVENATRTKNFLEDLNAGKLKLSDLAARENRVVKTAQKLGMKGDMPQELGKNAGATVFISVPGSYKSIATENGQAIIQVTDAQLPTIADSAKDEIGQIRQTLSQNNREEGFSLFLTGLNEKFGAKVNESLLKQVYGPKEEANQPEGAN